jgi:hypothetical protein
MVTSETRRAQAEEYLRLEVEARARAEEMLARRRELMRAEMFARWGVKPGVMVVGWSQPYVVMHVHLPSEWPTRPPGLTVRAILKDGLPGTRDLSLWGSDWRLA